MAGNVTPSSVAYYVAKAAPVFVFTLTDDAGRAVNLSGATLSAYRLSLVNGAISRMYGTFTVTSASAGQATYQCTFLDLEYPGGWLIYISARLGAETYTREFNPVSLVVLPTPEYLAGLLMQEVDLNVNGAPNTTNNPIYADIVDRIARVLGHVIIDSMPNIAGTVTPQVGGVNVSGNNPMPISGPVTPQVASAAVSTSNPLPTTSGQVGLITPKNTNGATTGNGADYQFKWTNDATVQRVIISNETGADVRYEFDATASANSLRLKDGNVVFVQQPCTVLHLYTASSMNVNQASGVMVRGYN